jgi:hypothetical protein
MAKYEVCGNEYARHQQMQAFINDLKIGQLARKAEAA